MHLGSDSHYSATSNQIQRELIRFGGDKGLDDPARCRPSRGAGQDHSPAAFLHTRTAIRFDTPVLLY